MTVVRRIARPLLAAPYVAGGVDSFRHPGPRVEGARPIVDKLATSPLKVPNDPELVVRVAGAASAGAGLLLATGRLPRLSALVLLATSAPGLSYKHPFWKEKEPEAKRAERKLFLKDVGLLGGALLAAVDTAGQPGVGYRGRKAATAAKRNARGARKAAKVAAHDAKLSTLLAVREAQLSAHSGPSLGEKAAKGRKELVKQAKATQKDVAKKTAPKRKDLKKQAKATQKDLAKQAVAARKELGKQAAQAQKDAAKQFAATRKDLGKKAAKAQKNASSTFSDASSSVREYLPV